MGMDITSSEYPSSTGSPPPSRGLSEYTNLVMAPPSQRGRSARAQEDVDPYTLPVLGRRSRAPSTGRHASRLGSRTRATGPSRARVEAQPIMQSTPAGAGAQRRGAALGRATSVGSAHSSDSGHFGSLQLFCAVCLELQKDLEKQRQEHARQREVERSLLQSLIDTERKQGVTEVKSLEARLQEKGKDFRVRLEEKEKDFRERLKEKEEHLNERHKVKMEHLEEMEERLKEKEQRFRMPDDQR